MAAQGENPNPSASVEEAKKDTGFPKIRGYFLKGPYNKDSSILVSLLGSPFRLGNCHIFARGYIRTTGGFMGIMYTGFRIVGFRGAKCGL